MPVTRPSTPASRMMLTAFGRGVEDGAAGADAQHAVAGVALGGERPAAARVEQRPAAQRLHEVAGERR